MKKENSTWHWPGLLYTPMENIMDFGKKLGTFGYSIKKRRKKKQKEMKDQKENIVLIGMPGSGKSTVGVILAKVFGYTFVDSDLLIQKEEKQLLKDIIAREGQDGFLRIENRVNKSIDTEKSVIATGGSVVYCQEAMEHLKKIGTVIYLKLDYQILNRRLSNLIGRGVVLKKGQTLKDLYEERVPLYEKYADYIIDEEKTNAEGTLQKILEILQ